LLSASWSFNPMSCNNKPRRMHKEIAGWGIIVKIVGQRIFFGGARSVGGNVFHKTFPLVDILFSVAILAVKAY
jgi:hypothetical protein